MISPVIWLWRARLYVMDKRLISSSAFSVAAFMATMRAICSLTAASRKHLNSLTLKLVGTTSSRMLSAEGRNSYCSLALRLAGRLCGGAAQIEPSGSSVSTTADLPADAFEPHVGHVEPVELAGDVVVEVAIGQHVDFVERGLVFEVRERSCQS